MTPLARILDRLPDARHGHNGWQARCPAHDDRNPSLSIKEAEDGKVLVHCHAGCATPDVVRALGVEMRDLMPANELPSVAPERPGPRPNARRNKQRNPVLFGTLSEAINAVEKRLRATCRYWIYHNATGEPVGAVLRFDLAEGKTYRPVSLRSGGWCLDAMPEPRPVFGMTAIAEASTVVVVEGEKAADAARLLGYVATTSAGGAKAARKTDWSPLAGKGVIILPDNDEAGYDYADDVADNLLSLSPPARVRIVALGGLSVGGDIADLVEGADASAMGKLRERVDREIAETPHLDGPEPEDGFAPYEPFPVHALPAPLARLVNAGASAIGCDASYIALPALAACGAAIGNSRRLQAKRDWLVPPILWCAVVGESGSAKTPAQKLALQATGLRDEEAFSDFEQKRLEHEQQLAAYERDLALFKSRKGGDEAPVRPKPPQQERFLLKDITLEALASRLAGNPRGALLAVDELAGWLQAFERYGNGKSQGDAARYLSLYSAENLIVDRKTGDLPTLRVAQAAVCIVGGIQPAILRRCFTQEHRDAGLLARFLLACPPRRAKKWSEAEIAPEIKDMYEAVILRLFAMTPDLSGGEGTFRPLVVRPSPEAKAMYQEFFDRHNHEARDLSGDLASAWSKLEEVPLRIALVIHGIRVVAGETMHDECEADGKSMASAIEVTEWFKREARRIYAMLHENDSAAEQRRLLDWIGKRGGSATTREVQQGMRGFETAVAARKALESLVAAGCGAWQEAGRTTRFVLKSPPESSAAQSVDDVDVDSGNVAESDWGAI
jgi:hypothetical protein